MVPPQQSLSDGIPFGIGQDLIVDINPRDTVNLYIDNFIDLTVNIEGSENAMRLKRAPLLRVSTAAQEVSEFEPLPQDDMDAQAKLIALIAEVGLSKQKVILGWMMDIHQMTIT
jgi:hypothetical protein